PMSISRSCYCSSFNDPPPPQIYPLSLHDALPISGVYRWFQGTSMAAPHVSGAVALLESVGVTNPAAVERLLAASARAPGAYGEQDRKSTRLNSSHVSISYAVFCLKKKKKQMCAKLVGANLRPPHLRPLTRLHVFLLQGLLCPPELQRLDAH